MYLHLGEDTAVAGEREGVSVLMLFDWLCEQMPAIQTRSPADRQVVLTAEHDRLPIDGLEVRAAIERNQTRIDAAAA